MLQTLSLVFLLFSFSLLLSVFSKEEREGGTRDVIYMQSMVDVDCGVHSPEVGQEQNDGVCVVSDSCFLISIYISFNFVIG